MNRIAHSASGAHRTVLRTARNLGAQGLRQTPLPRGPVARLRKRCGRKFTD
ncbi:hypothetical protein [Streptomyces sp. NPDC058614]|uniref:hypothetical protein n=1 Tax=Streptomyces sp. NPDC058614 TaxID=3346557 RepID=UPI0036519600